MLRKAFALAVALAACSGSAPDVADEDLPLGDRDPADMKADGTWGYALTCKDIPSLPPLVSPRITISLQGLTLHLVDSATGYDKVFPIGPGAIDHDAGLSNGESLSLWPVLAYGKHDFALEPATNVACKIWWKDPETGELSPVFAGLPFLSWSGSYGIHGPIDNFRAQNGGNLRRGLVSHGCVRMEAEDIKEVYARVKAVANVPVHVQREPERLADGTRVDVTPRWVGAECGADADCNYAGGLCKHNPWSERGFCTARCARTCADKAGYPTTFCVTDTDDATQGMCVPKVLATNEGCRPYDHFQPETMARFGQPSVAASVCLPGSPGWVGDHCFLDGDCDPGNRCVGADGATPGTCTQTCARTCPDQAGSATTFCVNEAALGGPVCLRTCTPATNAPECPADTQCVERTRNGTTTKRYVCEPS